MTLHYHSQGEGKPLIIIHGLFGSLDNWKRIASSLADHRQVISVDLRNHGQSPHHDTMTYAAMAQDIVALLSSLDLPQADIIGHSIGGKVAMTLATDYPERVGKLIVADIAPKRYPDRHSDIFNALQAIDVPQVNKRSDADTVLAKHIDDPAIRQFLLMNLTRTSEGFKWRLNLPVLAASYPNLLEPIGGDLVQHVSLFLRGALSDYIESQDSAMIRQHYPNADIITIEQAGHWLHAEQPEAFLQATQRFLLS